MDDNKIMQLVNCMKKAKKSGYCVFGIRVMDGSLKIGDSVPDSYDWDIVNDCSTYVTTGETLGGACAVSINDSLLLLDGSDDDEAFQEIQKAIEGSKNYYGKHIYMIGGKFGSEWGNDVNEIIIEDADVIGIVE